MLRRRPFRRRNRRHRLDALALARHHQAHTIVPQRPGPVGVSNHARQPLDITHKSRFNGFRSSQTHLSLPMLKCESCKINDSAEQSLRLTDSVVLDGYAELPDAGRAAFECWTMIIHTVWSLSCRQRFLRCLLVSLFRSDDVAMND